MQGSLFLAIFCLALAAAVADVIQIKDCGSKKAKIDSIDITPCPKIPCPFKKGTTVNVTINFTANADFAEATTSVHGIIAGVPVPFPMKDTDACHNMNCPVKSADKVVYKNGVEVLKQYPSLTVMVKWEIQTGNDDVICFAVPVKIVS